MSQNQFMKCKLSLYKMTYSTHSRNTFFMQRTSTRNSGLFSKDNKAQLPISDYSAM